MRKDVVFSEYGSYHRDRRNRACHAIGIPLIVLGLLGLSSQVHLGPLTLGIVVAVATLVFYATIDVPGAAISAIAFAVLYLAAFRLPWSLDVAAFVIGWIFQLVGHRYEGNKPKFLENLVYLLIGPLYMFEELTLGALRSKRAA